MKKAKLYKFTFYGAPSHWCESEPTAKEISEKIEESLSYVDELNQVTKVHVTKQSVKDC